MPALASRYLALFTAAPTADAGTGGTEVSGTYARVQVAGALAAAFTTSSTTITMGSANPGWVVAGMNVYDVTAGRNDLFCAGDCNLGHRGCLGHLRRGDVRQSDLLGLSRQFRVGAVHVFKCVARRAVDRHCKIQPWPLGRCPSLAAGIFASTQ
jgi:hypothetical protein